MACFYTPGFYIFKRSLKKKCQCNIMLWNHWHDYIDVYIYVWVAVCIYVFLHTHINTHRLQTININGHYSLWVIEQSIKSVCIKF